MTLGNAAAQVRLIVWCLDCRHQVEPDPAEMAERYGLLAMWRPKGGYGSQRNRVKWTPIVRQPEPSSKV
jgi:hypothetical protein